MKDSNLHRLIRSQASYPLNEQATENHRRALVLLFRDDRSENAVSRAGSIKI